MTRQRFVSYLLPLCSVSLFAGILLGQGAPDRSLIVNGKQQGTVVQMGGRSYVDVETVAQFTNGSITLEPTRVVLTFPAPGTAGPAGQNSPPSTPPAPPPQALSRNFASLAITALAEMREWRGAVGTILTYNTPIVGNWPQDYRDRVEATFNQVGLGASTAADEDALQLLRNEFSNLSEWASNVVAERQALNATESIRADAAQNDQNLAKINNCSRFLSSMLVSGTFTDNPSCH